MVKAQFYGIHLNKRNIATKVKEILKQYRGIKWVKTPKEVYEGPYISRAPDLLVMPDFNKGYKLASAKYTGRSTLQLTIMIITLKEYFLFIVQTLCLVLLKRMFLHG